jgi:hypothetical protein
MQVKAGNALVPVFVPVFSRLGFFAVQPEIAKKLNDEFRGD